MDAIALLKQDHVRVKELFSSLAETATRAVKRRGNCWGQMYFEAVEQHRAAEERVVPDLLHTDPSTDQSSCRANVLKELIEHHVEEEESEMFKDAIKLLSKAQVTELGQPMAARKEVLLVELKKG